MTEKELARIAFVTRRFSELQGLTLAALGGGLILGVVSWHLMPAEHRTVWQQLVFPAMVLQAPCSLAVLGFYARAFGRVPALQRDANRAVSTEVMAAIMVPLGLLLDMLRVLAGGGGASFACAAVAIHSLVVLGRDRGMRIYYLLPLAGGASGLAVTWSTPAMPRAAFEADPLGAGTFVVAYAVLGLALLAVGLLDHRLLATTMSRGPTVEFVPDAPVSRARLTAGASSLVVITPFLLFLRDSEYLGFVHLALVNGLIWGGFVLAKRFSDKQWDAAITAANRDEYVSAEPVPDDRRISLRFEPVGQLVLPMAMGAGAIADLGLAGSGAPSLLAMSFAASRLWIVARNWPRRTPYLVGAAAGAAGAVHFALTGPDDLLVWGVWFAFLVSAAAVVEGLSDLRLSRQSTAQVLE